MTQLTEARIRAAKPKGKPYKLRDDRGLYLRSSLHRVGDCGALDIGTRAGRA
jgi:hypothetical protein